MKRFNVTMTVEVDEESPYGVEHVEEAVRAEINDSHIISATMLGIHVEEIEGLPSGTHPVEVVNTFVRDNGLYCKIRFLSARMHGATEVIKISGG